MLAGVVAASASAAEPRLTDLSLVELMNEPVTTVSKKATRLGEAATAVTVISADDIRRNGITSIPEALRLVPGFDVARIAGGYWAISSRGFNLQYANNLLVLLDGRSVYTPAFGGVYWDAQDTLLDDLDRIEVIRGPGATLWGANAVNGVVNIITRSARETQGTLLSAATGTEDRPLLEARHGGALGENATFRVYGKYFSRDGLANETGGEAFDDWRSVRAGFRADWERSADQHLTLQGDYYSLHSDYLQTNLSYLPPYSERVAMERESTGANLLGRWTRTLSDTSHVSLQTYLDTYEMELEHRNTADVQLEHRFAPSARHDVVWGAGYRVSEDETHFGVDIITQPASRALHLYTAFLQDEISLLPEKLRLTVGAKLEHNDFTGFEAQPNLRLFFAPNLRHAFWAAASRAVSTPSRFYHDARYEAAAFQPPASPVVVATMMPAPYLPSQKLDAYELGYRVEVSAGLLVDLTAFHNEYRHLYRQVPGEPFFDVEPVPHVVQPLLWRADADGRAHGVEAAVSWRPLDVWQLSANYSWLHLRAPLTEALADGSPVHQASLRSHLRLSQTLELSSALYYVDSIETLAASLGSTHIPSYERFDTGLVYRPSATLEFGVWGKNLLDPYHAESSNRNAGVMLEVPRSLMARITKRF